MKAISDLFHRIWKAILRHKASIGAAAITALVLDIITGVIFGFGGAALFAAV